mgnify:CR=1 FL=1
MLKYYLIVALIVLTSAAATPLSALAQSGGLTLFGVQLNCDPSLPPDDSIGNGCGLQEVIQFMNGVLKFLLNTIIGPLAVLMLIVGGYYFLTAAGSPERMEKGKKIITIALIGVVIAAVAGIMVGILSGILTGQDVPLPT